MRREGWQHGMVRTHRILPTPINSPTRTIESTPTAGIFEKVKSFKQINHSKFTGKCRKVRCSDCHLNPACKSSEKSKGSFKLRGANDDVSRLRLLTWRVVDGGLGFGMSLGKSSEILKRIEEGNDVVKGEMEMDGGDEIQIEDEGGMDGGDEDETMSFCEVGYVLEQVGGDDDSWCLVAEM